MLSLFHFGGVARNGSSRLCISKRGWGGVVFLRGIFIHGTMGGSFCVCVWNTRSQTRTHSLTNYGTRFPRWSRLYLTIFSTRVCPYLVSSFVSASVLCARARVRACVCVCVGVPSPEMSASTRVPSRLTRTHTRTHFHTFTGEPARFVESVARFQGKCDPLGSGRVASRRTGPGRACGPPQRADGTEGWVHYTTGRDTRCG